MDCESPTAACLLLVATVTTWGCMDPEVTADLDGPFRIGVPIAVGAAPHGIRFSADGDTAYVALSGDGKIAVVNLAGPAVVARWDAGTTPLDLIRAGDGWLVSQFRDSTLIALDAAGRIVPGAVWNVGAGPSLFTPGTVRGQAWITSEFADRLWVVDTGAGTPARSHATGDRPYPADVMWDGSHAFVPNLDAGTVSVIDLLNLETDATVEVCPGPPGGALTPDQVTYIVACGGSDELAFVNTASFAVTGRITEGLGPRPFSVVVPASGRHAVVNNAGGNTVSVVDLESRVVVQTIEVGDQPIVVRVHPDGERVFVANEVSGTLVELIPVPEATSTADGATPAPSEVVVLGMIHGGHTTSESFSLQVVRDLVREIDPDYWLTEIPPNRWDRAWAEFQATDTVEEPRVRRFPEYMEGLFPLSRELDFEVIPTAGWTEPMSDFRAVYFDAYAQDPERADSWAEYQAAGAASADALAAGGPADDPRWIHTDAYDAAYDIRMQTYARLFAADLGPGGWDAINASHWANIERALDDHQGEGARFLLTYGAGHKGPFLRELRRRDDIVLLDLASFLDRLAATATAQPRPILIRAATVHTVTQGTLQPGEILIRDGIIAQVGPSVPSPADAQLYEAEVVIPGMIDAHAHLALDRSGRSRIPGPVTAEWKAVEHLNLDDPMILVALSGGVTSVITRSGSGIISSGQSVALKMKSTPGPDMIFKPYVDLKMAVRPLINLRPGETPQTVMGWYAIADDHFRRAKQYQDRQNAHAAGEGPAPEPDERLEAFAAVIRGDVMVHTHSHYPSEVMMVLRLARKYGFIDRLALAHAEEVFPLTELLAGTKIIPVIGPMMIVQYYNDPEPRNLLEELLDAGVHASIQTDMSQQHFKDFREYGAFLARHGLTDQQALQVMTINGARAMMLDDRVGSIEPGKDADLVLLDGHFLDLTADRIERVFVDGRLEYERDRVLQPDNPRAVGPFAPLINEVAPDDDTFAITGAHVFTISHGAIENATLVVENRKFTRVEAGATPPPGIPVIDAGGRVVMPGTIIARAFPNDWIGDLKWQVQNDEITEPVVPEMNALYAVDPWFPSYRVNTTVGVTAIHVTPGTRNLIGGNGVVVKTPGIDFEKMVRREPSSMVFALTASARREWTDETGAPMTLQRASAMIREALEAARDYAGAGAEEREYDPRHEALLPVLRRDVPAIIHADRLPEIEEALSIAVDYGLRLVVSGGVEAHKIADRLAAAGAGVILGNSGSYASDIRGGGEGWRVEGPAILNRAGVTVAFFGPGASRRASPIGRLGGEPILNAAWAFRNGVPEVDALKMATLNAAELVGMDDRVGSIEVGKDADFVVLEGHPFDYRVVPVMVFVDGRMEVGR